ncbi:MAG: phosphotransferase [Candidatus Promineifilaceae bacterium]|nr:phosphotransferase [Candidatus Promineifilaceae bacterium]
MPQLPQSPHQLTPALLTDLLRPHLLGEAHHIVALRSEPIALEAGSLGQLARLHLAYAPSTAHLPPTMIAKMHTADAAVAATGAIFTPDKIEHAFYRELAHQIPVRVPARYGSAMEPEAGRFLLLLEDLTRLPARGADQVAGCSLDEALRAVTTAARLHAGWWAHPKALPRWLPAAFTSGPVDAYVQNLYREAWPRFLARAREILPATARGRAWETMVHIGADLPAASAGAAASLARAPQTLIHVDFRLDNLFLTADEIIVVDWQDIHRGPGAYDLAYFIATSLDPALLREHEPSLLRHYHHTLQEEGVHDYSLADLHTHYRQSLYGCMEQMVLTAASVDRETRRGAALARVLVERLVGVFRRWIDRSAT